MQTLKRKPCVVAALLTVSAGLLFACGNASDTAAKEAPAVAPTAPLPADPEAKAAAYNFIDACITSSRARLGETKAFAYCKCMESQIRQTFGNTDSATVAGLQFDTATLGWFIRRCQ